MMEFKVKLKNIQTLLFTQRAARLILRAAWLGAAGYLVGWGIYRWFGIFPEHKWWLAIGVGFAVFPIAGIFRPLYLDKLVWRLDRWMVLREQITTAFRISSGPGTQNDVEKALVADAQALLPTVMHRIRHAGWYLGADLEALLLVGLLLLAVNLNNQLSENLRLPDAAVVQLPALAESPEFEDLFPSGISGLTDPPDTALEGKPQPATDDLSEGDISNIENILYDLGDQLSEYPETTDIGDALQKGDLQNAAAAIERTADEVDLLPEDARQNMQQALQQASQQANSTGQQGLAEDLETAAKALENPDPNNPMAADALDDLADNLRDLGETFASMGQPGVEASSPPPENEPQVGSAGGSPGSGSGAGGTSTSEPITRLEGEGGDFTIEGSDTPSGLLQPGSSSGTPITSETGSTSVGSSQAGNFSGTNNSVLTPYRYPWSWRNVVSEYFSP